MDVVVLVALCGLFLFLGYKSQQKYFTKQVEDLLLRTATTELALEDKLRAMEIKVADYDRLSHELLSARHMSQNVIPLEHHLSSVASIEEAKAEVSRELEEVKGKLDKSNGKQISERVRLGLIGENILPVLNGFPYDSSRVRGLFNPVDLLVFNDDEIVFVEVKTGDAKLTEKQRNIQRIIEEGKVRFEVHRLSDKGYDIK